MKKICKIVLYPIILIFAAALIYFAICFIQWNRNFNKKNLIRSFITPDNQTFVLTGTIHINHLNKNRRYSIRDLETMIEAVNPDYIFIEARKETFEKYGVVDGPVEMIYAYSYALEHNIGVRFVDWWVVDNNMRNNTTNENRDNKIFENIKTELKTVEENSTVMMLCGTAHFFVQPQRMLDDGWKKIKNQFKLNFKKSNDENFIYPSQLKQNISNKINYEILYGITEIKENIDDEERRKAELENVDFLVESLKAYRNIVNENRLYF